MTTFRITKTPFAFEAFRSTAFFLALFFLFFFAFYKGVGTDRSATNTTTPGVTAPTKKAAGEAGPAAGSFLASNSLYTLYLQNKAGSEQLKKLIGESNRRKLVLQLFRGGEGYLQLMAFPSTNGNGQYFLEDAVELSRSDVFNTPMPEGENIFFGDLQVADKSAQRKYTIRDLKAHLYDANNPGQNAGWEYIWFVPQLKEVSEGPFRGNYIVYALERSNEMPQVSSRKAFGLSFPLNDEANPSPPAKLQ